MKFRIGYVSNSSSSSFICELCNSEREGYNLSVEGSGLCMCEHGHWFGIEHLLSHIGYRSKGYGPTIIIEPDHVPIELIGASVIPEKYCPICHPENFTKEELEIQCGNDLDIEDMHKINPYGIVETFD